MRAGPYHPERVPVRAVRDHRAAGVSSSVQSLDFEDCRLQEIEWATLLSNGAFPDPIHTLKDCSLKYNTFAEINFNRFDFSNGNEIVGSMFAKCEMQLANFKGQRALTTASMTGIAYNASGMWCRPQGLVAGKNALGGGKYQWIAKKLEQLIF